MALISKVSEWSRIRKLRSELFAMTDAQLDDLGLCRADIPR